MMDSGDISMIQSSSYTESFSIDGVEIYNIDTAYSEYYGTLGYIRQDGASYAIGIDEDPEMSCTLTSDTLDCASDALSIQLTRNTTGIPETFEDVQANFPATPEYSKTECIDSTLTTTGNALEWGGFDGVEDDVALFVKMDIHIPMTALTILLGKRMPMIWFCIPSAK